MFHRFRAGFCLLFTLLLSIFLLLPAAAASTDSGAKLCAITFDDGPGEFTNGLLDELAKRDVKATFFVSGYRAVNYPNTLQRIVDEGHQLANHTHNHSNLNTLSASSVRAEINKTRDLLVAAGGDKAYYIRPPYGNANATVKSNANAPLIYWSVDPEDWKYRNADTVCANIVNGAYDGCIILVHDIHSTSVTGALAAIDKLQAQGYEFVTVEQLLLRRGVTPQNGVVYYDAKNKGVNLAAEQVPPQAYDESQLESHWAYDALSYCLKRGYLEKDVQGQVLPNKYITRGDFVSALGRFTGMSNAYGLGQSTGFTDVDDTMSCAPYVRWSTQAGLMLGTGDRFRPDSNLTREQMAVVLARYLTMTGKAAPGGSVALYRDVARISDWATDGVSLCSQLGILQGSSGSFHPKSPLTRAETAVILQRLATY